MKQTKLMILIWNMGIGGIQKRVKDIVIDLSTNPKYRHVHVTLVVKYQEPSFFTQELIEKTDSQRFNLVFYTPSHQKSKGFPSFFWVLKQYLQYKPDVLLTFLDHLSITAILLKLFVFWHQCRVVLNEGVLTSRYLLINRGKLAHFWMGMITFFYGLADRIIVPSQAVKKDLITNFKVPPTIISVIPNWTLFVPPTKSVTPKYDLAYVGRYEEEKDPLLFLEVVRQLAQDYPNIKACMVGSGKLEATIVSFLAHHRLKSKVTLLSPKNNMQQVLPKCKLLVVTSKNEGLPNVVLEAAALRIPSIAAPFIGVEEVILDAQTGWIRQSAQDMSSLILSLLPRPSLVKKVGKKAQTHITKNFSHANQAKFIQELLQLD